MTSEIKIDDTFPESKFLIECFSKPHSQGLGILLYKRNHTPCRYIKQIPLNNSFEGFFVELKLGSKKWVLRCSYNYHKENIAFTLAT